MIDPENITNYNQTEAQLEESILFWVCAAGKNGRTAARCLGNLLNAIDGYNIGPFKAIQMWAYYEHPETFEGWPELLRDNGIGCYRSKAKTMFQLAMNDLDLKTCSVEDLEAIHGIGMKTARCFLIHSREGVRLAGIDTHMLKHLKAVGVPNVPSSTPGNKKEYLRLEKEFLRLADDVGKEPAVFDLEIWNKYSIKSLPQTLTKEK